MKKFLKKFSKVPNGFIEDFFNISKERYNDDELSIDFNIVVKWLNVQKAHLKRLLIAHFEEKYDYIVYVEKKKNQNGPGANYVDNIWITPDCFKELCMISRTAKAKEVRMYYLSIEKLIRKYHRYIEQKLYKKINLLEKNQKSKVNIKGGIIYFFKALNHIKIEDLDEDDLYKIGKTKNKKTRFTQYNSGTANDIEPLFILEVNDIDKVESCIKNLLKDYQYRKHKEIYKISVDALKIVFSKCDDLVSGFKKFMKKNSTKTADRSFEKMRNAEYGLVLYIKKLNESIR